MNIVVTKEMHTPRNSAVWELGYNICLDVHQTADSVPGDLASSMRNAATSIPLNISRAGEFRSRKRKLACLSKVHLALRDLSTLVLLAYDLNYIKKQQYLEIINDLNEFGARLSKFLQILRTKRKK